MGRSTKGSTKDDGLQKEVMKTPKSSPEGSDVLTVSHASSSKVHLLALFVFCNQESSRNDLTSKK